MKEVFLRAISGESANSVKAIPGCARVVCRNVSLIRAQRFFLTLIENVTPRVRPSA
jgi:hypothetical protein